MSDTYTVKMQELKHRIFSLETKTNNVPIGYDVVYTTFKDPGDYVYYGTFVVAFGEGVHRDGEYPYLTRLFANGEEIFNTFTGTFKPGLKFKYFNGSEDQDIVYRDMNYRGLMCVVFTDLNLTDYGNNIPAITAEFYDSATVVAGTYQQKGFYSTTWPIKSVQLSSDLGRFHASGQDVPDTYMPGWFPTPPLSIKSVILDTSTLGLVSNISPPFGRFEIVDDTRTAWITEARARFVYTDYGPLSTDKRLQLESDTEIGVVSGPLFIPTAFIPASAAGNSGSAVAPVRGLARMRLKSGATTRHYAVMYNVNGGNRDYSIWYYDPAWRLRWAAQGSGVGPWFSSYDPAYPSTVIPGRETDGESVMYVQTHREIARLVCRATGDHTVGVVETIKFYENTTDRNIQQCFYDSVNDRVIALNIMADGINAQFVSINQDGSIAWTSEEFPKPSQKSGHLDGEGTSDLSAGTLVVTRETTPRILTRLDTATGEVLAYKAPTTTFKADQLTVWDSRFTRLWVSDLSYVNVGAQEPISGGSTDAFQGAYTVSELMRAYAKHVGFTDDEIVTVNLDHMKVYGYVHSSSGALPEVITNVGSLYGFNWFMAADTITFKSVYDANGTLVVDLVLTEDDIATSAGASTDNFSVNINDDNTAPAKTTFTYFDINNEYKAGTVKAARGMDPLPTHKSTSEQNFTVPVTMEAKQAQELLFSMLSRAWAGKTTYAFRVPSDGIIINPIDVINFSVNGFSYNAIVTQPRVNADFSVSLTLTEAAGAVHPAKVEVQPPRVIPSFAKPARVLLFDMPDLKTGLYETDFFNLLAIAGSYDRLNFTGAVLEEISQDNPRDVQPVLSFGADEQGYIGTVEQAPMAWPEYEYLDTFNSLIIHADNIPADKFVSATVEEMAADKNLIVIGSQSRTEVMAFGSAEALGDNRWRLTNLLRGRYGTDVNIGLVASSTGFAFLENYKIHQIRKEVVADQIPLNFRGRNSRQPAWTVDPEQIRIVGNSRKPYAPVNVYGKRDGDGNVFFEWVRRARFINNPEIPFEPQPPLDEVVNRWRIKIWDSEFTFVYRQDEFEAFAIDEDDLPQYIYDISMQESEFNVLGDVAYVTLEQISFPNGFGLNALVVYGFTHKYVVPIIPFGSVMLKARISGEGELNTDVQVTPVSTIRGVIQGGGELTAIMLEAVRLSGTIAGAGELVAVVAEPQPVSGAIAAGGALSGAIPAPVFLGAAIAGEGALSVDLSVIPAVVLAAVIEGGGELVASASADRELAGTIDGGGELTASVVIPKVITGTMEAGGELTANAYISKPMAGTIEAGGAMTANVTTPRLLSGAIEGEGGLLGNVEIPVPSTFAAALYTRSVDASPDTASSPRLVSFDSTVFENGGFTLESGTDVVIPSGVNFIDISASVKITDNVNTTGFAIYVMKNGGYYTIKSTRNTADGFADNQLRLEMPGVPVNPGDRIAIRYSEISSATIQVLAKYTYLGIKKAEG